MFYGLLAGRIDSGPFEIESVSAALPALNDCASRGELEATMISAAAYPYLRNRYVLARCGACFARGHGPVLAAREPINENDLTYASVAVPDATSSECVALQLSRPGMRTRLLPADKIAQAAQIGLADCALLSHCDGTDGRQAGLQCVDDVAARWARSADDMPLPMTCLAIRSDLAGDVREQLEELFRQSIRYGLAHRIEAERFAAGLSAGSLSANHSSRTLGLYVSESALEMPEADRSALEEFLRRGRDAHIVPDALPIHYVGDPS
jgi:1,4-dihydroxy-6-naphthoate synthase